MWDEEHRHQPAGRDQDLRHRRRRLQVPVHGQGRRLGQQELPVPGDQGRCSTPRACCVPRREAAPLGTAACPPYHLAVVIGGTSAEFALEDGQARLGRYLDTCPPRATAGHGFRDLELEAEVLKLTQALRHRRPVRRQVLLPRRAGDPPAPPRRLVPGRPSPCRARPTARRSARSPPTACSSSSSSADPAQYLPEVTHDDLGGDVVKIDLNRPMARSAPSCRKYPVKTRLSLTGTVVVARDIAHAKIKERASTRRRDARVPADHPVYYAGPAKTPEGYASGSFGPTTAGRMDSYVDQFQAAGGSLVMLAKGNRSQAGHRRLQGPRRLLPRLDRRPRRPPRPGLHQEGRGARVPRARHGGRVAIEVEDFPAFIVVDDKGNDFFGSGRDSDPSLPSSWCASGAHRLVPLGQFLAALRSPNGVCAVGISGREPETRAGNVANVPGPGLPGQDRPRHPRRGVVADLTGVRRRQRSPRCQSA
jgi:tartrate dehydratase beta subunit/fumarate hydratase class I family protein